MVVASLVVELLVVESLVAASLVVVAAADSWPASESKYSYTSAASPPMLYSSVVEVGGPDEGTA